MAQKETTITSSFGNTVAPKSKFKILPAALFIACIASLGVSGFLYYQNMQLKKNPQVLAQQEVQKLMAQVSRLIVLPEGETPTIATVADPEKLSDQSFFTKAQKGDKVLIYTNARKAILYNPTTDKIVEVAPISIGNNTAAASVTQPKK